MAKTIRLAAGGYVTRSWGGEVFEFCVGGGSGVAGDVVIEPTRSEMLAIAGLFRRAAMKLTKEGNEKPVYEAPRLTYLGRHKPTCALLRNSIGLCNCGGVP